MKNFLKPLAVCFLAGLLLTNCKDEKKNDPINNDPTVNEITIGDKKYTVQNIGLLEAYGADDGSDPDWQYAGYNFDITLIDKNINLVLDSQGQIDSATGSGLFLTLETFSSDSTRLADGTYVIDTDSPFSTSSFDYGAYATDWSYSGSSTEVEVNSGSFIVTSSGNTYTIVLDLIDENNKKITGTFKGTFIME